jgi:hypothetical protein
MADPPWKDLTDCDVQDKECLALFRAKMREWQKCLDDDLKDHHSIAYQMLILLNDDAVWRTFFEACCLSEQPNDRSSGLSKIFINLLGGGYLTRQSMAIRRLIEPLEYNPQKAVYSLRSLLEDIRDNQHLFTRENYVCYDGVTYKSSRREPVQSSQQRRSRQYSYDVISSVGSVNRQREDKLDSGFIKKLEKRFRVFEDLRTYINKFIAHASHPSNRPNSEIRDKMTLAYLDGCYKELICIAKGIEILLDDFALCNVPTPQFNQFKNWDKPIVTTADKANLRKFWSDRSLEVRNWGDEATKRYRPIE